MTNGTSKTLRMVIGVKGFDPSVTSLNRESTGDTFGGEHLIPILFTIRVSVLHVERVVSKGCPTVSASEALRMPLFVEGHQAFLS